MELTLERKTSCLQVILGSLFIGVCTWIYLPTIPVPTTLQTFSLFILALTLGPEQAFFSALLYIVFLPPMWLIGPSGGYLLAFPLGCYVIGKMERRMSACNAIFCGQLLIYACGVGWLTHFLDWRGALINGMLIFLPTALMKNFAAVYIIRRFK